MGTIVFNNLGEVLDEVHKGNIIDGDILTNLNTNERVIIKDGNLHFLTLGDYVSNEVPLVKGMIQARWSMEEREYIEIDLEEAIKAVSNGVSVTLEDGIKVDNITDLIKESEELASASDFLSITDLRYEVDPQYKQPNKYARKTTETEAWAILIDRTFFDYTAEELAEKYQISERNVYYILDGSYYKKVYDRFNQLVKTGELYV